MSLETLVIPDSSSTGVQSQEVKPITEGSTVSLIEKFFDGALKIGGAVAEHDLSRRQIESSAASSVDSEGMPDDTVPQDPFMERNATALILGGAAVLVAVVYFSNK